MVRKPHGIASSFGDTTSVLDQIINQQQWPIPQLQDQRSKQTQNKELGLVNRLDIVTAGLLFFAKNPSIYAEYKILQEQGKTQKIYYADLWGEFTQTTEVTTPIYHHYSDNARMTVQSDIARWKAHQVQTQIIPLFYDQEKNYTTCQITIAKGIRHQIRVHTASIGHHILGDKLYCPKHIKSHYDGKAIHLRSMGMQVQD